MQRLIERVYCRARKSGWTIWRSTKRGLRGEGGEGGSSGPPLSPRKKSWRFTCPLVSINVRLAATGSGGNQARADGSAKEKEERKRTAFSRSAPASVPKGLPANLLRIVRLMAKPRPPTAADRSRQTGARSVQRGPARSTDERTARTAPRASRSSSDIPVAAFHRTCHLQDLHVTPARVVVWGGRRSDKSESGPHVPLRFDGESGPRRAGSRAVSHRDLSVCS